MRALLVACLACLAPAGFAQPLEPPPESPEGQDYTAEPADSLAEGDVELGLGATGRAGSVPTRRRRVRFGSDDLRGAVREGRGDPLAGGSIDGHSRLGRFTIGRLAPRWGRGLLLGAPGEPWQRAAPDRGPRAPFRGRAGEGVMLHRGREGSFEALYGRFGRRRLAGLRLSLRSGALAVLTGGGGAHQASLAWAPGPLDSEIAFDRVGRWRAEALVERPLGSARAVAPGEPPPVSGRPAAGWTASARVRAGAPGFASLAEGGRRGPAQALAAELSGPAGPMRVSLLGALWRFRPAVTGARAGLAIERPLPHHGAVALGVEEQRGVRREDSRSPATRAGRLRQGWWGEWWSGRGSIALGVRHESWGERPRVRGVVRSVTSARLETQCPGGVLLGVAHSVYRVRRGESLYLPEAESDRLVLRALAGEGERSRIELRAPWAGGRLRAVLLLAPAHGRRMVPEWTLDWTRRARTRRPAGQRPG